MLRLTTLGAIDLRDRNGHPIRSVLGQPKRLALLIYLAVEGRNAPVSRETLMALFWPASDAAHARNALSQALHHLRHALGPRIIENQGTVALSLPPSALWCDATTFVAAIERGEEKLALDLYRGEFCPTLFVGGAEPFDAWLERQRRTLDGMADSAAARRPAAVTAPRSQRGAGRRRLTVAAAAAALLLAATGAGWAYRSYRIDVALNPGLVVVAPFRVGAADTSLAFLHEGMVDLLAAKLTGSAGLRALDPRTVMRATARRAGNRADLDQRDLLELARDFGGGRLLLGSVVGRRDRFTLTAHLLDTRTGLAHASTVMEGTLDSLPQLVDAMVGRLLAAGAGESESHLAELTTSSLPAMTAYLEGRRAFRAGRYDDALTAFREATEADTTFALAWLEYTRAADWVADANTQVPSERAWRLRQRLPQGDRALLVAMRGPQYPKWATMSQRFQGWLSASRLTPDRSDVWYGLGDTYFHLGPVAGFDSGFVRAEAAFARAVQLDSAFAAPLEHLVELSLLRGDLPAARRWMSLYHACDSTSDAAIYLRWRTALAFGDRAGAAAIESALDTLPDGVLYRIAAWPVYDGAGIPTAWRAAQLYLRRTARAPSFFAERVYAQAAANLGHFSEWTRVVHNMRRAAAVAADTVADRAFWMAGWDGDIPAGETALVHLTERRARFYRWSLDCWKATLRLLMPPAGAEATSGYARACRGGARDQTTALLVALLHAGTDRSRNLDSLLAVIDSVRLTSTGTGGSNVWSLYAGAALMARGEFARARDAYRRREVGAGDASSGLAALVRREGLAAELAGDTAGAVRAYRHYLALRYDPDPGVRPWADSVRAALARLTQR